MDKVVNIINLKTKTSDLKYWQSKSYQERFDAIELLRSQYINFNNHVQPRLIRVCQIINRKSS